VERLYQLRKLRLDTVLTKVAIMLNESVRAIETVAINASFISDVEELKRIKLLLLRLADKIDDKIIDIEPEPKE
jgi:hypothetical protein